MKAIRFVISGIVQGVGFRAFAVHAARSRGVTGWVRNLPDGRVESLAEGEPAALDLFRDDLTQGPPGARVRDIEEVEEPIAGGFRGFDIAW